MSQNEHIPWVEKYRPTCFNNIVFDEYNKIIFNNIISQNYIPNLILYGPPGTGKTTTIINLINIYQKNNNQENKGLMIHLNASDERGIDIIRNQINTFVNSKTLFYTGIKFVVLDEVDYMTKNAQIALKYVIQEYNCNVRFCLICNYISKIDESLQQELMRIRFNQLPKDNVIDFLNHINKTENLELEQHHLKSIQQNFKSDMRSMINYMQSNQLAIKNTKVISNTIYIDILNLLKNNNYNKFHKYIKSISSNYNIDIKTILKCFINYIIRYLPHDINSEKLKNFELIIHYPDGNIDCQLRYIYYIFNEKQT